MSISPPPYPVHICPAPFHPSSLHPSLSLPPPFFLLFQVDGVAHLLRDRCEALGPQDLANVLCSLARLGFRPEVQWMGSLMAKVGGGGGGVIRMRGGGAWEEGGSGSH